MLYWLPPYVVQGYRRIKRQPVGNPRHIMLCFVDHYEPFNGNVNLEKAIQRVEAWKIGYPQMANKFVDADGKHPQHTWFYPPHLDHRFLEDLVNLCKQGYGEVEMHLHHNHMDPFPDTSETLKDKIRQCIKDYGKYGIFCLPDGRKAFAFIHGDWSLDNSGGAKLCGVNNEIKILKEMGCFADFTFPSINQCQPRMVNTLYYCKDDPSRPKSYDKGIEVKIGLPPKDVDLLMVTGPIGLRLKKWRFRIPVPAIESDALEIIPPKPERIDFWIDRKIRVKGQDNWIFTKVHTHGAAEYNHDLNLGVGAQGMYDYLLQKYNDGREFILHFVTAREMYNIIKAAEAGCSGNPNDYRDYLIPKYVYK